jgi:hypothetical protein
VHVESERTMSDDLLATRRFKSLDGEWTLSTEFFGQSACKFRQRAQEAFYGPSDNGSLYAFHLSA